MIGCIFYPSLGLQHIRITPSLLLLEPMYSGLWCEDNTMRLSCMASDVIHIEDAFFGRDNAITCSGDRDVTDTECTSASVHDVISTHCNNKNSCVLNVNNVTLGEPCLGTYKYLNINFTCSGTLRE